MTNQTFYLNRDERTALESGKPLKLRLNTTRGWCVAGYFATKLECLEKVSEWHTLNTERGSSVQLLGWNAIDMTEWKTAA